MRSPLYSAFLLPLALLSGCALLRPGPQSTVPIDRAAEAALTPITAEQPWLFRNSDIPPDPAWTFGELPNGLRYAVRRNGVPPGQVSVRVRVDAGSLMEREPEQGFAHLLEHLSFRGSAHVPNGEARRVWQRLGATFGSDSNASTTPTMTVYKLDLPSANEAGLDESLKILAGMAAAPQITQEALDAERPAVLAERREQPGPQVRVGDATRELFFAGQPLANRVPIGTEATLTAATPETVRAFHERWYRPDRTVVVVSGDMDPAMLQQLVVKNFSSWTPTGPKPDEPDFGKPVADGPVSAAVTEPSLPPVVSFAVLRPWTLVDDTIKFNQDRMVDQLAVRVINRRLESRARAGGSYLSADIDLEDVSRSANATVVTLVPVGDDWEAALKDVRTVIADAQATPPTQAEIDREVADVLAASKAGVDSARAEPSAGQADQIVGAVDIRETAASAEVSYAIMAQAVRQKRFTPAAILEASRRVFKGTVTRIISNSRTPGDNLSARLASALEADVAVPAGDRARLAAVSFRKLPKLGKAGTVAGRRVIPGLEMEQITYANGVRALVSSTSSEASRVYVRVRFGNGLSALPGDSITAAWAGEMALMPSGIGTLGQEELDRLTAGRRIGLDFDIVEDAFVLAATTSADDLTDQLRLMALKLTQPNWDPNPVVRARAVALAGYPGLASSPSGVLQRDLESLLHDGDPRWGTPSQEAITALTPESFRALWEPLLATGPIEVQVFGDVPSEQAVAAIAATFGAIPPRAAAPPSGAPVRFPAHVAAPVLRTHDGPEEQAAAVIAWPTGGGVPGIAESRKLDVLAAVFRDRLFDKLREASGASYSPNVGSDWPIGLDSGGRIIALGMVEPDKLDLFFTIARGIAADLANTPISEDELKRTMLPMMQFILRASSGNTFWIRQTEGGTQDPRRLDAVRQLSRDLSTITPLDLQGVAAKYLRPEADWTMTVVPKAYAARMSAGQAVTAE